MIITGVDQNLNGLAPIWCLQIGSSLVGVEYDGGNEMLFPTNDARMGEFTYYTISEARRDHRRFINATLISCLEKGYMLASYKSEIISTDKAIYMIEEDIDADNISFKLSEEGHKAMEEGRV